MGSWRLLLWALGPLLGRMPAYAPDMSRRSRFERCFVGCRPGAVIGISGGRDRSWAVPCVAGCADRLLGTLGRTLDATSSVELYDGGMSGPDKPLRRLAAVLAADVVGYSRMMGVDEDATLSAWWRHRREVIDP